MQKAGRYYVSAIIDDEKDYSSFWNDKWSVKSEFGR